MCARKFSKIYVLALLVTLVSSTLGISYAYWTDVNILHCQVKTAKFTPAETGSTQSKYKIRSMEWDSLLTCNYDQETVEMVIEAEEEEGIEIPLTYAGYEIYTIGEGGYFSDAAHEADGLLIENRDITRGKVQYYELGADNLQVQLNIDKEQLATTLEAKGICSTSPCMVRLKVFLKQEGYDVNDEAGWGYSMTKRLQGIFREPKVEEVDSIKKEPGVVNAQEVENLNEVPVLGNEQEVIDEK